MIALKNIKIADIFRGVLYLGFIVAVLFSKQKNWWVLLFFAIMLAYTILKYAKPHWKIFNPDRTKPKFDFINSLGIFKYTEDGFTVTLNDKPQPFKWDDITRIVAYKEDLLAVDEICLLTEDKNGRGFTVSESVNGWYQFTVALQKHFGFDEWWMAKVAQPPFARNEMVLFEKK